MRKNKNHLPFMGVGPLYVFVIIALTVVGIVLSESGFFDVGKSDVLRIPFAIIGTVLIALGLFFWIGANFGSKIDDHIRSNTLAQTGVYAYVRNPIYSAFLMFCTGALLWANNVCLLVLPIVYWIFLTVLMKCTEEKWLLELHSEEYVQYCRRVNRCIPWFKNER